MLQIKKTEEIGTKLGYTNPSVQYAVVVGYLGGKIEIIANIIDNLWAKPGLEYDDLHRALMSIDLAIKDVVEEG